MILIDLPVVKNRSYTPRERSNSPASRRPVFCASTRRHSYPTADLRSKTVVNATDFYEVGTPLPSANPHCIELLAAAAMRVRTPSMWERLGDHIEQTVMQVRKWSIGWSSRAAGSLASDWEQLRGGPSAAWYQAFVFGTPTERVGAYTERLHAKYELPCCMRLLSLKKRGDVWDPAVRELARGLLYRVLGNVSEGQAITLVREALEHLKRNNEVRRYVNPVRIAGPVSNDLDDVFRERGQVRSLVGDVRHVFDVLARYLEDDVVRRQLFAIPQLTVANKLDVAHTPEKVLAKCLRVLTSPLRRLLASASRIVAPAINGLRWARTGRPRM